MSGLTCSCAGDIRLYTATIDGYEQQALLRVCVCVWSGKPCAVQTVGCWFQSPIPAHASQLISLQNPSQP